VKGKNEPEHQALLADARALAEAGAFAIVLELVTPRVAKEVTQAVPIPTIGIGAGPDCDGQILVCHDLLGLFPDTPKHVKRYANLAEEMRRAFAQYKDEVERGEFRGVRRIAEGIDSGDEHASVPQVAVEVRGQGRRGGEQNNAKEDGEQTFGLLSQVSPDGRLQSGWRCQPPMTCHFPARMSRRIRRNRAGSYSSTQR
jgi:hypothetical protein